MKPLGIQHIAEFIGCKKDILNNASVLEKLVLTGIKESGLNHESIISHQFSPGVTVLAIISESHIGLHTYPEAKHVSLDVFTCSVPEKQIKLIKFLRKSLKPRIVKIVEIQRGNPIEFIEKNWLTSLSDYGFEVSYHYTKKIYSKKSKYQMIDIIENENFGRMLFLDKDLQIAEYDSDTYNKALVDPIRHSRKKIKTAAILGGGDGGILYELLKLKPLSISLVDIDSKVIQVSKKYLSDICHGAFDDPRVNIINGDAIKFLDEDNKFDAIVYDLTMHPEAFTRMNRVDFLNGLFMKVRSRLKKRGILTLQVGSEYDASTLKLSKNILSKHFVDQKYYTVFIPSFCENWIFASARIK